MKQLPMHEDLPFDEAATASRVSTGDLPLHTEIRELVTDAYERYRGNDSGKVADYIPVLANASPDLTVSPGKGGLATYSPPLDAAGNSIRGQLAIKDLAERLGLNLFASVPAEGPRRSSDRPLTDPPGGVSVSTRRRA